MWRSVVAVAAMLWIAQTAWADELRIVGNYDVQWCPSAESSHYFVVGIDNVSEASPTPNLLQGWQIVCTIIPAATSTGTVSFGNLSDYVTVFNGVSVHISEDTRTSSDTTGLIFGALDAPGATVPTTVADLLQIELTASSNASGTFYIAVLPDSTADSQSDDSDTSYFGAAWYSSDYIATAFDGMPFGSDAVNIGSVVIVPEASVAILLLSGAMVLAIGWFGRRWRTSWTYLVG